MKKNTGQNTVKRGIRFSLMAMFAVLITASLLSMGTMMYTKSVEILQKNVEASSAQVLNEIDNSIAHYMQQFDFITHFLQDDANVTNVIANEDSKQWMLSLFDSILDNNQDVMNAYIGTVNREMILRPQQDLPNGYDPTSRPWYKDAAEAKEVIWTEPYTDASTGTLIISAAAPVYEKTGSKKFVGVVALDIDLSTLAEKANQAVIGKEGYVTLVSPSRTILTHPKVQDFVGVNMVSDPEGVELTAEQKTKNEDMRVKLKPISEGIDQLEAQIAKDPEANSIFISYKLNGQEKYAVIRKTELGWYLIGALAKNEITADAMKILNYLVIIGIITLLLAILASFVYAQRLTGAVKVMLKKMEQVKNGDLTIGFKSNRKDELGLLGDYLTSTVSDLGVLVQSIQQVSTEVTTSAQSLAATSEETSASSEEVAKTVNEIAKGASEQAQEADNGVRVVQSLSDKFAQLNQRTKSMLQAAESVSAANREGVKTVDQLKDKTVKTDMANDRIEDVILELDNKSQSIGAILDSISAIAVQTNLLALNASIEAARAGEHGRGFAVVAEEIRKLAEQSSSAAGEIRIIVTNILSDSTKTVSSMKEVKGISREQSSAVDEVNLSFNSITDSIQHISVEIDAISHFIEALNKDKELIVQSITNISAVSEETAAASEEVSASMDQQSLAVEEVAKSAERLNEISVELNAAARRFKV